MRINASRESRRCGIENNIQSAVCPMKRDDRINRFISRCLNNLERLYENHFHFSVFSRRRTTSDPSNVLLQSLRRPVECENNSSNRANRSRLENETFYHFHQSRLVIHVPFHYFPVCELRALSLFVLFYSWQRVSSLTLC